MLFAGRVHHGARPAPNPGPGLQLVGCAAPHAPKRRVFAASPGPSCCIVPCLCTCTWVVADRHPHAWSRRPRHDARLQPSSAPSLGPPLAVMCLCTHVQVVADCHAHAQGRQPHQRRAPHRAAAAVCVPALAAGGLAWRAGAGGWGGRRRCAGAGVQCLAACSCHKLLPQFNPHPSHARSAPVPSPPVPFPAPQFCSVPFFHPQHTSNPLSPPSPSPFHPPPQQPRQGPPRENRGRKDPVRAWRFRLLCPLHPQHDPKPLAPPSPLSPALTARQGPCQGRQDPCRAGSNGAAARSRSASPRGA
jgi:hypothetical protein